MFNDSNEVILKVCYSRNKQGIFYEVFRDIYVKLVRRSKQLQEKIFEEYFCDRKTLI